MDLVPNPPGELHIKVLPQDEGGQGNVPDLAQKLVLLASFVKELQTNKHSN